MNTIVLELPILTNKEIVRAKFRRAVQRWNPHVWMKDLSSLSPPLRRSTLSVPMLIRIRLERCLSMVDSSDFRAAGQEVTQTELKHQKANGAAD